MHAWRARHVEQHRRGAVAPADHQAEPVAADVDGGEARRRRQGSRPCGPGPAAAAVASTTRRLAQCRDAGPPQVQRKPPAGWPAPAGERDTVRGAHHHRQHREHPRARPGRRPLPRDRPNGLRCGAVDGGSVRTPARQFERAATNATPGATSIAQRDRLAHPARTATRRAQPDRPERLRSRSADRAASTTPRRSPSPPPRAPPPRHSIVHGLEHRAARAAGGIGRRSRRRRVSLDQVGPRLW